jgi:tetratricopeptide (TPR) repeat protein
VAHALLLDYYRRLPGRLQTDDPDSWAARRAADLEDFRRQVGAHYTEGTLARLTAAADTETRTAAVVALGVLGSMSSNGALAARLHDDEPAVRRSAADALWAVWFRGAADADRLELDRLVRLPELGEALRGLDALVARAPEFAEAVNQRAIVRFRRGEFAASARDCERVLRLNPHHFGAASGLGQCLVRLDRPRAALEAFRNALRIYPDLDGVSEAVRVLEASLGDGA